MNKHIKEFETCIDKYKKRNSTGKIGIELSKAQEDIKQKKLISEARCWLDECAEKKAPFLFALDCLGKIPSKKDFMIINNLYNNAPENDIETRRTLLEIGKNMILGENIYHYSEIYAIAAFLHDEGLTGETLYIGESIEDGVYELRSVISNNIVLVKIKNSKTKKTFNELFGRKSSVFAMFITKQPA